MVNYKEKSFFKKNKKNKKKWHDLFAQRAEKKERLFCKKKQKKTQKHKNTKKIKIILLKIYLKKFK